MRARQVRLQSTRRYRQLILGLVGLGLLALAPRSDATAQSREIYLGSTVTRDGRNPATPPPSYAPPAYAPPAYAPTAPRPYGWQRQNSETDGLLEDALDDLSRSRVLEARRLLEMVVEQFGETASADEARRLLAPIYARMHGQPRSPADSVNGASNAPANAQPNAAPGWGEGARTDSARAGALSRDPQRPAALERDEFGQDPVAERKWKLDANRIQALEQDFRANVGDRIFFGEASAELGSRSRVVLAAQAEWLKRYPDVSIGIEAHADDHGSLDFNRELARRRAAAVRERLVEEGVDASRIRVSPQGRENPVATCADAACAAQNRRVVTQLLPPGRQPASQPGVASGGGIGTGAGAGYGTAAGAPNVNGRRN